MSPRILAGLRTNFINILGLLMTVQEPSVRVVSGTFDYWLFLKKRGEPGIAAVTGVAGSLLMPGGWWVYPGYGVPGHGAYPGTPPWYWSGYPSTALSPLWPCLSPLWPCLYPLWPCLSVFCRGLAVFCRVFQWFSENFMIFSDFQRISWFLENFPISSCFLENFPFSSC